MTSTLLPTLLADLAAFAAGQGHPDYPCLSRTHAPGSCVPCADFSPWLRDRVKRGDVEGVGEYLFRVREANPGLGESAETLRNQYGQLAAALLAAPLDRYLIGDENALLDLRVTLVLLAVHEGFSGFILTGEAPDFVASVMAPHALRLRDGAELVEARNRFISAMAGEMSYWAGWPVLAADALLSPTPPNDPELHRLLDVLGSLPLGARAHAVDALRQLAAHPHVPRTLASLSRYETRKRGLDVTESSRLILATGLVVPAGNLEGWLGTWTRRDLLGFLAQAGVGARNSWGKERLIAVAQTQSAELLRARMQDAGVVELAPRHAAGAQHLRAYLDEVRVTWRVWLGFGTGIG